jgi:hypothetical protein
MLEKYANYCCAINDPQNLKSVILFLFLCIIKTILFSQFEFFLKCPLQFSEYILS